MSDIAHIDCTFQNPCTIGASDAADYARGYHDGMLSSVTIILAITCALALIWWLKWLTK